MNEALALEHSGSDRADRKRRTILDGARRAFTTQGFEATSMDTVAAAAGVSKATAYRYFGSKEELFSGVVADMCSRIIDADLAAMMARLPPVEALRSFGHRMVRIIFAPETLALHRIVIAESRRFPALGRLFYDSGPGGCIALLASYLRRRKREVALKIADPHQAAEEFMMLLRGHEHMRALLGVETAPPPRKLEDRVERAIRHLLS
jgi:TetR/AcrR family transcriptional repressor of mexJK operon